MGYSWGLSSTIVYTSELILCSTICVPSATRHNIHNLRNSLFIGFVKFEIEQRFAAYQGQFCAWFSLARLPNETARKSFLGHFLKETAFSLISSSGFSNLFNASARLICILSFAQSRKILS